MCLAFPGKIISIKNNKAMVDFDGIVKEVNSSLVKAVKGDYVVVHTGFAIQVMKGKEAREVFELYENAKGIKKNK